MVIGWPHKVPERVPESMDHILRTTLKATKDKWKEQENPANIKDDFSLSILIIDPTPPGWFPQLIQTFPQSAVSTTVGKTKHPLFAPEQGHIQGLIYRVTLLWTANPTKIQPDPPHHLLALISLPEPIFREWCSKALKKVQMTNQPHWFHLAS
jgi:hypothetical protein